jgi:hypothetical protein
MNRISYTILQNSKLAQGDAYQAICWSDNLKWSSVLTQTINLYFSSEGWECYCRTRGLFRSSKFTAYLHSFHSMQLPSAASPWIDLPHSWNHSSKDICWISLN